jgi:hypothetical protein
MAPRPLLRAEYRSLANTKNGTEAVQLLPVPLGDLVPVWPASRPACRPILEAMPAKTAVTISVDLTAATILYETDSGFADFHAFRAAYIPNLLTPSASVQTCQLLARHSNPSLTIGV